MKLKTILAICFMAGISSSAFAEKSISLDELRMHNSEADCWMAIDGDVYNMSPYMKLHAKKCKEMNFADHCGTDASAVWGEKEKSKSPHKKKSHRGLAQSKVGKFVPQ